MLPSASLLYPNEHRTTWASFRQQLAYADAPKQKHADSSLLSSELTAAPADAYAAICIINRDQHEDLVEWVAYHQVIQLSSRAAKVCPPPGGSGLNCHGAHAEPGVQAVPL